MGRGSNSSQANGQQLLFGPRTSKGRPQPVAPDYWYLDQLQSLKPQSDWPTDICQYWPQLADEFIPVLRRHEQTQQNPTPVTVHSYLGPRWDHNGFTLFIVDRTERGRLYTKPLSLNEALDHLNNFWANWISGSPGGLADRHDFHQAWQAEQR